MYKFHGLWMCESVCVAILYWIRHRSCDNCQNKLKQIRKGVPCTSLEPKPKKVPYLSDSQDLKWHYRIMLYNCIPIQRFYIDCQGLAWIHGNLQKPRGSTARVWLRHFVKEEVSSPDLSERWVQCCQKGKGFWYKNALTDSHGELNHLSHGFIAWEASKVEELFEW